MLDSSNPVLARDDSFNEFYGQAAGTVRDNVTTMQGICNKTALLVGIAVVTGAGGYALHGMMPGLAWGASIVGLLVSFGIGMFLMGNPAKAKIVGPIYAIAQGVFLGALTGSLDGVLVKMGITVPHLALQAFVITIGILMAMLGLYKARILQPTKKFVAVVSTMMAGIGIIYLISFVLMLFGTSLPFVSLGSAFEGGTSAWIGVGINVLFLGVAALGLIIDFGLIEEKVSQGAPKDMEWYCSFALIVSLAWIYFEALKLSFRLAIMLSGRD
jgi:uncharacterized YccA/Bax inhibitor family protein